MTKKCKSNDQGGQISNCPLVVITRGHLKYSYAKKLIYAHR